MHDSIRTIELGNGVVAVVDAEDFERVSALRWHVHHGSTRAYARCTKPNVYMHRFILNAGPEHQVDHRDRDGLNNRRSNLRFATRTQNHGNQAMNAGNRCGFKGVYVANRGGRYASQITFGGKKTHLGCFATAEEAARAYDSAARELFGEFARTNFEELT